MGLKLVSALYKFVTYLLRHLPTLTAPVPHAYIVDSKAAQKQRKNVCYVRFILQCNDACRKPCIQPNNVLRPTLSVRLAGEEVQQGGWASDLRSKALPVGRGCLTTLDNLFTPLYRCHLTKQ